MTELWNKLLKLNWDRDFYLIKSSEEKTFLWEILCERLNRDEVYLQDFQMDRVPVSLILIELSLREDLVDKLPEVFLGKFYGYIRSRLRNRENLIQSRKIVQDYGTDIGVDIKINALKELESLQKTATKIKERLLESSSVKLRLKAKMIF